jgi:hypothetical protein
MVKVAHGMGSKNGNGRCEWGDIFGMIEAEKRHNGI